MYIVCLLPYRNALQALPPLSISPHSPSKPEFLSPFVVKEMDSFLKTLWYVLYMYIYYRDNIPQYIFRVLPKAL